jgi:hypothetical protein
MTPKTRRYLRLFTALVGVAALATYATHWYNVNIRWPRDIQTHLFGRELAFHDELISREGSLTLFAQGVFRWDYRIRPDNRWVQTVCGNQSLQTCRLTKSVQLLPNVLLTGELHNGVLTLEEWWS